MKNKRPVVMRAMLVAAALGLAQAALAEVNPFGPIHVAANRQQYTGRQCPIDVLYTATINFEMPHPRGLTFNYHWERSDGAKGPVQVVHPGPNQRSYVVRERWRLGAPGNSYDAGTTIYVNSGNTHLSESSPLVRIRCN
jgi:hypothetical protein